MNKTRLHFCSIYNLISVWNLKYLNENCCLYYCQKSWPHISDSFRVQNSYYCHIKNSDANICICLHEIFRLLLSFSMSSQIKLYECHIHNLFLEWVKELGFNVPPTPRSHGDGWFLFYVCFWKETWKWQLHDWPFTMHMLLIKLNSKNYKWKDFMKLLTPKLLRLL